MDEPSPNWASYTEPNSELVRRSLACFGAGEQRGAIAPFHGRRLATHGLVQVVRGQGWYETGGQRRRVAVRAPAVIHLFPGVEHTYGPDADGWHERWLLFDGPAVRAFEDLGLLRVADPVVGLTGTWASGGTILAAIRAALADVGTRGNVRAAALVHRALVELIDLARPDGGSVHSTVVQAVADGAFTPRSSAVRARELGLSVAALRRIVAAETGLGLLDYVVTLRIARAQTLLAQTTTPVARVGREVGYDDPAYFARIFAARTGRSPSAFRAEHQR